MMMIADVAERNTSASALEHTVLLQVKHLNMAYETGATPVHNVITSINNEQENR